MAHAAMNYSAISVTMNSVLRGPIELSVTFCIFLVFVYKLAYVLSDRKRNPWRLPLPPGPKGYPVIGNLLDMPTSYQWRTFAEWGKVYGDITSVEVLGQHIMIINSLEVVQDLFEKRSANYSDRKQTTMLLELMNFNYLLTVMPYGQWWRKNRRAFNEIFHASASKKYQSVQARETRAFLHKLLQSPDMFLAHIRHALASTIMSVLYDIKIKDTNDLYMKNVEDSLAGFNAASIPGSFLVDYFPVLKHVPNWFPGAGFKKKAEFWAQANKNIRELPFNHVAQQMKQGKAGPSITATLISELPDGDEKQVAEARTIAQNATATAYLGGADTTISAVQTFFLAMALYPDVQRKAQVELDRDIGTGRLPEYSDRPALPYINAVINETLRWQVVAPLAVPHVSTCDNVYNGYFIPKGTVLIGNSWAMLQDESVYTNPEEFSPERFLKDGQLDPSARLPDVAFGFGRRVCPGRHFAENTLFIIVVSTLHAFTITPMLEKNADSIPLSPRMTSGTLSYPQPFRVDIKPRSSSIEKCVRDAVLADN